MPSKTQTKKLIIATSQYSGCGNDFLLMDNREGIIPELSPDCIKQLCQPKTGAGVDGLIIATHSNSADVAMRYYNCDGSEAEMCGNGARCLMQYLRQKCHYPRTRCLLETKLRDLVLSCEGSDISVNMGTIHDYGWNIEVDHNGKKYFIQHLNTGVPHVVIFTENLDDVDVETLGKFFRFHERFAPQGANINFVEPVHTQPEFTAHIRTYERGVERETQACGTGVTAAARCLQKLHNFQSPISLRVQSGEWLQVLFEEHGDKLDNVILKGPATWIRDGAIELDPQTLSFTLSFS